MSVDDILDHEVARLQTLIENRKIGLLQTLFQSKGSLFVIAITVFVFQLRNLPEKLAKSSLDGAISIQRPEKPVVVRMVVVDDEDYATLFNHRSPLEPQTLSRLLMAVAQGGPSVIVIDFDTSDSIFRAMQIPSIPTVWNMSGEEIAGDRFKVDPPLGGRHLPSTAVAALAVVPRDDRGIVRGYRRVFNLEDHGSVDSPSNAVLRLLRPAEMNAKTARDQRFLDFRYQFTFIKARNLLSDAEKDPWKTMSLFRNQVVVIGGIYHVARDTYATPKGVLNGSTIVAQAIESELDGTSIAAASRWVSGLLLVAGGLAIVATYHWLSFRRAFVLSILFVPLLSVVSNWILFHRLTAWGAMVPLVLAVILAELYAKGSLYLGFYEKASSLAVRTPVVSSNVS